MARVTVEDCIDKVPNRFELVLLASHRARTISAGAQIAVDRDNDKNPVVALREIADEKVDCDDLREDFIHSMQKYVEVDEPEAEAVPMLSADTQNADPRPGRSVERHRDRQDDRGRAVAQDGEPSAVRWLQCGTALALISPPWPWVVSPTAERHTGRRPVSSFLSRFATSGFGALGSGFRRNDGDGARP